VPLLEASKARAAIVAESDARLKTESITWPGAQGVTMTGYLAMPRTASGDLPAVMVVHENRGLNPHIKDVARRFALEGFLALAPDFLAPQGGTPEDEDAARQKFEAIDSAQVVENAVVTVGFLKNHELSNGNVGAVGFCFGGGIVNQTAVHAGEDLVAGVVYYGRAPEAADVQNIRAKMLFHYAGLDERVNAGMAGYEEALKAANVEYQMHLYEGANHAFNNDTSEARYHREAAELAWSRTVEFLKSALS
jgi:carboxymethylenebutenolidase